MKHIRLLLVSILFSAIGIITGCQNDTEAFDNKIYHESGIKVNTILLKGITDQVSKNISAFIAKPENKEIVITYKADPSLVDTYNAAYYEKAILLPEENYEIPQNQVKIAVGSTHSTEITVTFKELKKLDMERTYVLPITMAEVNLNIIESSRTIYYVFKGAALINTVANISENSLYVAWKKPEVVNNMTEITVEALIWPNKFEQTISTLMGIEGGFLIRFGDAGLAGNQLQVVNQKQKASSSEWVIPTKEWVHLAITYSSSTGIVEVYINGKKKEVGVAGWSPVDWGAEHVSIENEHSGNRCFWIGHSYNNERYFDGNISECRIWNRILSKEEVNVDGHFYTVDANSEGLIAYWKFDEGNGTTIKDYTANGNDVTASTPLKWKAVELPKK